MAYMTLQDIGRDVITLLSQAGGVGTQRYAETRIQLIANCLFDTLFDRQWWPQFMQWYDLPLDGSSGTVVGDISAIKRFDDIRMIYYNYSDRPLSVLSSEGNPYNIGASSVVGYTSNASKVFEVWGKSSTNNVQFHARLQPDRYKPSETVKFDATALIYGTVWWYLEDDASNPGATQKFQTLFEKRIEQLELNLKGMPIAMYPNGIQPPTEWWPR